MRIGNFVIFERVPDVERLWEAVQHAEATLDRYRRASHILFNGRIEQIERQIVDFMLTLELTEKNLRKGVDPEDNHITMTDLNYESFNKAYTAGIVVYTSPTGKVRTLKNRYGATGEGRYENREIAGTD